MKVRLAGGEQRETGRVEVQLGGKWGTLCDIDFDHLDAQVSQRSQRHVNIYVYVTQNIVMWKWHQSSGCSLFVLLCSLAVSR